MWEWLFLQIRNILFYKGPWIHATVKITKILLWRMFRLLFLANQILSECSLGFVRLYAPFFVAFSKDQTELAPFANYGLISFLRYIIRIFKSITDI